MAAGRAGGGHDALVLERGDDVGVLARAVFAVDRPVHEVVAGGGNDGAHGFRDFLILHFVVDGPGGAHLGAHAAFARGELAAEFGVDGGLLGDRLREGDVDRRGGADELVELVRGLLGGALVHAGAAASALGPVDVGGLLLHGHGEVAHIPGHVGHFGSGHERDFGMLGDVDHLGAEDAARAVDGGEGLVELRHLAADVAFAFHEEHVEARVGAVEGGLDAGHAAADDEHALGGFEGLGEQRVVAAQFFNGDADEFRGLVGVGFLVLADPRHVFADIGHFKHVLVEPGAFHGAAEGGLVHTRRTGSDDHAVKLVFLDGGDDFFLSGFRAGVHGVGGEGHIGIGFGDLSDLAAIHGPGDVRSAVADKNAYFHALASSVASSALAAAALAACAASIFRRSSSGLTQSFSKPSS